MSTQFNQTSEGFLLSAIHDIPDIRDRIYQPALIELQPKMNPPQNLVILDQKQEGACTGFGLAAVINGLKSLRGIETKLAENRASARMLYEMAQKHDQWPGEDYSGSSCRGAIRGWNNMGVCSEKLWPYLPNDSSTLTLARAKAAREDTIGAYYRLRPNIVDYHSALNEAKVLYVSANVHKGWENTSIPSNGIIPLDEEKTGGHAFAIVGYNEQGFWVQNSWGSQWGQGGIALWTYEDWHAHIIDGWVIQMAIPTPQIWHLSRDSAKENPENKANWWGGVKRGKIEGHFVHIDDGQFHDNGKYWSNFDDVKETANLIEGTEKYNHLLLYAHGGLNSAKDSAKRIKAMKKTYKANGIYPFHFMYDTGLIEEIKDIIFGKRSRTEGRMGSFSSHSDKLIENLSRRPGRAIWKEMKSDAQQAFKEGNAGSQSIRVLIDAALQNQTPLKIHIAGHSTGAILLAHLIERARVYFPELRIASCSLMAPACTIELFQALYLPFLNTSASSFGLEAMNVYNLTDDLEKDDTVTPLYRKSLLYLVSNAFEEKAKAPLLGMEKFSKNISSPNLEIVFSDGSHRRSRSRAHGGFDNDPTTMNNILSKILGGTPHRKFTEDDLDY